MAKTDIFNDGHEIKTICFLIRTNSKGENEYLLGMHRKQKKWNGVGGKVGDKEEFKNETVEQGAKREVEEELGVKALNLIFKGVIKFNINKDFHVKANIYFVDKWKGEIKGIEIDSPTWYTIDNFPWNQMWDTDKIWVTKLVNSNSPITAEYTFYEGGRYKEDFFKLLS